MINTTFHDIAEVASKQYNKEAREELEKQLSYFTKECSTKVIKQLGLPQVLMFFSSSVAKSNNHEVIQTSDVRDGFSFLKYIISSDSVEELLLNNTLNLGLPPTEMPQGRLNQLLKIKGDIRSKNNLNLKVSRLLDFMTDHKLQEKHIKRIEVELRASILFLSRMFCISRLRTNSIVTSEDIDVAYDITRYLMLKLQSNKFKILSILYSIDDEKIWRKIPKMVFDQSAHDHLSKTAYADWENELPESFEALKKHINCSSRPFLAAILGYSELYGAKNQVSRVSTEELMYILEEYEKTIFGNSNPMIVEDRGMVINFTEEGLETLANISGWITNLIVKKLGKHEFVFNFASTVPRQISLLLFMSIVEAIKNHDQKIDITHILKSLMKWTSILQVLQLDQS